MIDAAVSSGRMCEQTDRLANRCMHALARSSSDPDELGAAGSVTPRLH
jgi:hypothetical protein